MLDTKIPDFSLPATSGQTFTLVGPGRQDRGDLLLSQGQHAGLHHAKARTSATCIPSSAAVDAVILGISRDSLKSHENFKAKQDPSPSNSARMPMKRYATCSASSSMKMMYGKQVPRHRTQHLSSSTATAFCAANGAASRSPGHVQEVLDFVKTL